MKLLLKQAAAGNDRRHIIVEHHGRELYWSANTFERSREDEDVDPFKEFNQFVATLDQATTEKLFSFYQESYAIFQRRPTIDRLMKGIVPLVSQYFEFMTFEKADWWRTFKSSITIPEEFPDTFDMSSEKLGTRERTYLKSDYRELLAMTLLLRGIVPLWGEFGQYNKELKATWIYYEAFKFLSEASIRNAPAMEKLLGFIQYPITEEVPITSAIVSGISTEDFPIWLLSVVVVRRLSFTSMQSVETGKHLVSNIYRFIMNRLQSTNKAFTGPIKDKIPTSESSGDGESSLSRLEDYNRTREEIPQGYPAAAEFILSKPDTIYLAIVPHGRMETLFSAQEIVTARNTIVPEACQGVLARWVVARHIPFGMYDYLEGEAIFNMIAIATAALWETGHKELAALVSATTIDKDEEGLTISVDGRRRLAQSYITELDELYPYHRRQGGKNGKLRNMAIDDIESLDAQLNEHEWQLTLSDAWMQELGRGSQRQYAVPPDIKNILARLIIQLGSRTFGTV